ncbi:MAG: sigma-70 family RNA polymerase sigma factor [Bdellovibrionaceae bacterium]|nr:sigma-70 family RNA polymerase sigma factor [Pseudobdellovibrionaceae bacterium]MCB9093228.1 sigma-70 family RNA polymerase sigma factor [Halobacteriovoraceae bacterium]
MERKVKKTISPCVAKGKYGGKRGGAYRFYQGEGEIIVPSGCECACPWVRFGAKLNEPKKQSYFLNLENQRLSLTKPNANDKSAIAIIPCSEAFLLPTSPATKKYKEVTGAKFRGCYPLEEKLLAENEIRHEPFDNLSVEEEKQTLDDPDILPGTDKLLTTASEMSAFHIKAHKAYHKQQELWWTEARTPSSYTPSNPFEFGAYLQDILNELEDLSNILTPKQKEAVRLVYLENEKGLSNPEIAKKLKIAADSLKDRLSGALARITKIRPGYKFPERRMTSEQAKKWESPDAEMDGLYRKSHSGPLALRLLDPKTKKVKKTIKPADFKKYGFGSKKLKSGVDEKAIKKWAFEQTPIPRFI